jgi:hypothetical protein
VIVSVNGECVRIAVPVVQGAPWTVTLTAAATKADPPTPIGESGTLRFATAEPQGRNRQKRITPPSGIAPPIFPPTVSATLPAPFATSR